MFDNLNIWSKSTYKILKVLSADPNERLHVREIARQSEISPSTASNILRDLEQENMLAKEIVGRQTFYSVNMNNPVIKQFKVFDNVLNLYHIVHKIKEVSDKIVLFGSAAKGTNTKNSDIDLFIKTSSPDDVKGRIKGYEIISPIITRPEDFTMFKKENEALYENIKRGIVLWSREDEL
ncbi:MAG: nucleotidyltransferase domain-containing protein [Candidatus Saliniplasma sp.]